jgi:hypothetical protein
VTEPSDEALPAWAITEAINELAEFAADGFFEVQTDAAARNERHVKRLAKRCDATYRRGIEDAAQEPADGWKLPCDVACGHIRFRKGVALQTLVIAATRWLKAAQKIEAGELSEELRCALAPPQEGSS